MLERFFKAKSFIFHIPKPIQVPKLTYFGYVCKSCMYTHHVCMLCMCSMHLRYACILCMYSMHVIYACVLYMDSYACILYMYSMHVFYACILCMHSMYVFYACILCMNTKNDHLPDVRKKPPAINGTFPKDCFKDVLTVF